MYNRPSECYGDVFLSVQASEMHYSTPRITGLPLEEYCEVEIAIIQEPEGFLLPSEIGIDGFDDLFAGNDVAGYVPQERVTALRAALTARANQ